MKILQRGPGWVAVDKPAGLPVIPGRSEGPCVQRLLEQELDRRLWVVHRLDRDTSGVLLFALDAERHRVLSQAFEHGEIKKHYLALVEGRLEAPLDLAWPLAPARRSRMRVDPQGKPSRTLVRPLEVFAAATLVEAQPLTGRTHQIRVHLAHAGHPLLFDHQYRRAPPHASCARTPLHAARLLWGELLLESPPPDDIASALNLLRSGAP